jgi:hypothetical protein
VVGVVVNRVLPARSVFRRLREIYGPAGEGEPPRADVLLVIGPAREADAEALSRRLDPAENRVQWLFLDLNAFSRRASSRRPLRGKPVIVVQTPAETAVAIAASYAAKAYGIKTGTLVRRPRRGRARRRCW